MKSFPKILIIFFLAVFILQLVCLFFLFSLPQASLAAAPPTFKPQVEIPGTATEFGAVDPKTGGYAIPGSTASIAKYVRLIYKYAIGIVGILAAVVLMIGGVMWIVAGGNATAIGEAKAWIGASLTGLLLALMSYLILATVNPALVDFKTTAIPGVSQGPTILTKFDASTPCGQEIPGQQRICGSQCPAGKKCEKVPRGTPGARECPLTWTASQTGMGNGDYYLCSDLSGGGTNCCNDNVPCPSGYMCDTSVPYAQLTFCTNNISSPQGICRAGSAAGGIQENQNCKGLEDQCASDLKCVGDSITKRCQKIGAPCGSGNAGGCVESLGGLLNCGNKERLMLGSSCPLGLYCCK